MHLFVAGLAPAARIERATRFALVSISPSGVAHHSRLARHTRRSVIREIRSCGTANIPKRAVVAQVLLGREREACKVRKRRQVVRMNARFVELATIDTLRVFVKRGSATT